MAASRFFGTVCQESDFPRQWPDPDTIKDRSGNSLNLPGDLSANVFFPTAYIVTDWKLFGGNYGFIVSPPFVKTRYASSRFETRSGKRRRYRCLACGQTFSSTKGTPYYRLQHRRARFDAVVALRVEGVSISAIARVEGIARRPCERSSVSASDDHRRPILGACGAITGWVWRPKGVDPPFVAETGSGSSKWCVWKKMTRFGECEPAIIGLEGR